MRRVSRNHRWVFRVVVEESQHSDDDGKCMLRHDRQEEEMAMIGVSNQGNWQGYYAEQDQQQLITHCFPPVEDGKQRVLALQLSAAVPLKKTRLAKSLACLAPGVVGADDLPSGSPGTPGHFSLSARFASFFYSKRVCQNSTSSSYFISSSAV